MDKLVKARLKRMSKFVKARLIRRCNKTGKITGKRILFMKERLIYKTISCFLMNENVITDLNRGILTLDGKDYTHTLVLVKSTWLSSFSLRTRRAA